MNIKLGFYYFISSSMYVFMYVFLNNVIMIRQVK